jgi:hypothetical protein
MVMESQVFTKIKDTQYALCLRVMNIAVYTDVMYSVYAPVLNRVGRRINIK